LPTEAGASQDVLLRDGKDTDTELADLYGSLLILMELGDFPMVSLQDGGQLDVTDDLEIRGPGAELVAVNGKDESRVFAISRGVTALLAGLTITRG
jgi:hypothetical protein